MRVSPGRGRGQGIEDKGLGEAVTPITRPIFPSGCCFGRDRDFCRSAGFRRRALKLGLLSAHRDFACSAGRRDWGTDLQREEGGARSAAAAVQLRKGLATQLVLAPFFVLAFIPQAVGLALRGDPFWWLMAIGVLGVMLAMAFACISDLELIKPQFGGCRLQSAGCRRQPGSS